MTNTASENEDPRSELAKAVDEAEAKRAERTSRIVKAWESIADEADAALASDDAQARENAASNIVTLGASMWLDGLRLGAIAVDAQTKIVSAIVSDMSRDK